MKIETGIHPGRWHMGAWVLLALLLAMSLLLSHRATGVASAWAAPDAGAREEGGGNGPRSGESAPGEQTPLPTVPRVLPGGTGDAYVAEVVDTLFFISATGFLALDLPRDPPGKRAIHLSGNVNVRGRNRDIIVRLFRRKDYDVWLHPRAGSKAEPIWVSKRGRAHQLDLALPEQGPFVLLLDNGYSIRTPKHVSCQLQIEYRRSGLGAEAVQAGPAGRRTGGADTTSGVYDEANPVNPRGNTDDQTPPPPPPPPAGY